MISDTQAERDMQSWYAMALDQLLLAPSLTLPTLKIISPVSLTNMKSSRLVTDYELVGSRKLLLVKNVKFKHYLPWPINLSKS